MKLFALLVGINRYKAIRGLNACETDVNSVKTYLTESHSSDANIKTLIDQEATRDAIVNNFRTHLKQAKQGDVAFFYFSGHGVRQKANDVFKSSSLNDNIECITCHDTTLDGRNLLSDRYSACAGRPVTLGPIFLAAAVSPSPSPNGSPLANPSSDSAEAPDSRR